MGNLRIRSRGRHFVLDAVAILLLLLLLNRGHEWLNVKLSG